MTLSRGKKQSNTFSEGLARAKRGGLVTRDGQGLTYVSQTECWCILAELLLEITSMILLRLPPQEPNTFAQRRARQDLNHWKSTSPASETALHSETQMRPMSDERDSFLLVAHGSFPHHLNVNIQS